MAAKKKAKKKAVSRVARRTAKGAKRAVPAKKAKAAKAKAVKTVKKAAARRFVVRRQPETLRLTSAGPSFTVNDIHASLAFYRDVLGFTPKERWERGGQLLGVELVAGRVSFWIGQDDWKKGRDRVKGLGFRIYCGTSQDIDTLASRIKSRGVALAEEPKDQPWGGRDFAVADPDGFALTFSSGM
jgi:uncharacterized glyoxalase superfamily protein PhnB